MSNKLKWIIVGFAWIFLGAALNIMYAIKAFEPSVIQTVFAFGLYGGFVMILIGVFAAVDKPKEENDRND